MWVPEWSRTHKYTNSGKVLQIKVFLHCIFRCRSPNLILLQSLWNLNRDEAQCCLGCCKKIRFFRFIFRFFQPAFELCFFSKKLVLAWPVRSDPLLVKELFHIVQKNMKQNLKNLIFLQDRKQPWDRPLSNFWVAGMNIKLQSANMMLVKKPWFATLFQN